MFKMWVLGIITALIATFALLYPGTLKKPLPEKHNITVIVIKETKAYTDTVYVKAETDTVFIEGEIKEIISSDSIWIEEDNFRGYFKTCYEHFADRFVHDYKFEVDKETVIIEQKKTFYEERPVKIFRAWIYGSYLKGIGSKSLNLDFGGRLYEKIRAGLGISVFYENKKTIFQYGLGIGYDW